MARLEITLKDSRSTFFLWVGGALIVLAWAAYALRFILSEQFPWLPSWIPLEEKEMAAWGQFGDFLGGALNPILSFLALLAVVKNLRLQALQLAQAHDDQFATNVANRMAALKAASDILTVSIDQDISVTNKGGPVRDDQFQEKLRRREEITSELLRLANQLLDEPEGALR